VNVLYNVSKSEIGIKNMSTKDKTKKENEIILSIPEIVLERIELSLNPIEIEIESFEFAEDIPELELGKNIPELELGKDIPELEFHDYGISYNRKKD